jgi:hypothetical protein
MSNLQQGQEQGQGQGQEQGIKIRWQTLENEPMKLMMDETVTTCSFEKITLTQRPLLRRQGAIRQENEDETFIDTVDESYILVTFNQVYPSEYILK